MLERRDWSIAIGLALGMVALSWSLAAAAGAAGIARTDDWAFGRVAFDLHQTGHLHLVGWGPMTLIGLVVWAQPWLWLFGDHWWAVDLAGSALCAVGVVAAHRLARRLLTPVLALVAVVSILAYPGVLRDATTFMTDGPAFALQAVVLAVGAGALRSTGRRRLLLLVAVGALGFWAFTIRELAIAAPIAVLAAAFFNERRPGRRRVIALATLFGGGCLAFWIWRKSLAGDQPYAGHPDAWTAVNLVASACFTAALGLAPALAWSVRRWWRPVHVRGRVIGWFAGGAIAAVLPIVAWHQDRHLWWFVGDYLQPNGMNGDKLAVGYRPIVLARPLWDALVVLAVVALVAAGGLVGEAAARRMSPRYDHRGPAGVKAVLVWHVVASAAVLVVAAAWNGALFDRYLWPAILSGALLVLARTGSRASFAPLVGGGVLALISVASLALTVNSAAFDGARWQAGRDAVNAGVPADQIDAGFEWAGAHGTTVARGAAAVNDPLVSWWSQSFGMPALCRVVTSSPVTSAESTTKAWRTFLVAGSAKLRIYSRC